MKLCSSHTKRPAYLAGFSFAHWHIDDAGEMTAVRYQARGTFKRMKRPIPSSEIRGKADEIRALEEELRRLRDRLHSPAPESPDPATT
jgi:hypothetical protein